MPRIAHYYQDCPTCGRTLQVRVEYLGRSLSCPHCRGNFQAIDPGALALDRQIDGLELVDRANELLESVHVHEHTGFH
ncbi:MAG: hypothetical protein CMJ80_17305 [Planctomycetaceae bacterium]|nr:hypothetical protein [Planctomycetaceae bacterium]